MKNLELQAAIAKGRFNLRDLERPPYAINQNLRDPNWVKQFKDQLAEAANLQELMRGDRVNVGRTFGLERKVAEMAENAVNKIAQEQQAKQNLQSAKNLQAPEKQEQIQPKQMEMPPMGK